MIKKVLGIALGIILLLTLRQTAFAQSASTLQADKTRAQVGETVTVSGSWTAGKLVSIKGTNPDGDIVYYGVARADEKGAFSAPIQVPDMAPGMLTITAGNGSAVSNVQVQIYVLQYYTVTFDKNGGDGDANPTSITAAEESHITNLPVSPVKTGYGFGGWYKEKECTNAWNFISDVVEGNMTLYAKWNINTYAVKFFCQDGKTQIGTTQTVAWGSAATMEIAPSVSEYTFGKWGLVGDNDSVETSLVCVKENIVATAIYSRNAAESSQPSAAESPKASNTQPGEPSAAVSSTAVSSVSSSPEVPSSAQPSAAAEPSAEKTVTPVQVEQDSQTGKIKITLDISSLPKGTQALMLPNGSVVKIDKTAKTVTLEIDPADVGKDGTVQIVFLDEKGVPLTALDIKTSGLSFQEIGYSLWIWIIVGAGILALLLFLLYRELRRRKDGIINRHQ